MYMYVCVRMYVNIYTYTHKHTLYINICISVEYRLDEPLKKSS